MVDDDTNAMIIQMSYNVVEGENEVLTNVCKTEGLFPFSKITLLQYFNSFGLNPLPIAFHSEKNLRLLCISHLKTLQQVLHSLRLLFIFTP